MTPLSFVFACFVLLLTFAASNAISWGGLGPEMFGTNGVYHMVPICLAIGVFLPLPFIAAVRHFLLYFDQLRTRMLTAMSRFVVVYVAQGRIRELQHANHSAVVLRPLRRSKHAGEPEHGDWPLLAVVGAHALPALVHQVQVRLPCPSIGLVLMR